MQIQIVFHGISASMNGRFASFVFAHGWLMAFPRHRVEGLGGGEGGREGGGGVGEGGGRLEGGREGGDARGITIDI